MSPRAGLDHLYARQQDWMHHGQHLDGHSSSSPSSRRESLASVQSVTAAGRRGSASLGLGALQEVLEETLHEAGPPASQRPELAPIQTAIKDDAQQRPAVDFDTSSPFSNLFNGWPRVASLPVSTAASATPSVDPLASDPRSGARSDSASSTSSFPLSDLTSPGSASTALTTPSVSSASISTRLDEAKSALPSTSLPPGSPRAHCSSLGHGPAQPYRRSSLGRSPGMRAASSAQAGAFGGSLPSVMRAAGSGPGGAESQRAEGSVRSAGSMSSGSEHGQGLREPGGPGAGQGGGGAGGSGGMGSEGSKRRESKKKAAKACSHCQRAHLTCDDARPCQRCVKRGTADSCVDGQRKKAKYLMDEEEKARLRNLPKSAKRASDSATESGANAGGRPSISAPQHPYGSMGAPEGMTGGQGQGALQQPQQQQQQQQQQQRLGVPNMQSGVNANAQSFGPSDPQSIAMSPAPAYPMMPNDALRDGFPMGTEFLQDTDPIFDLNYDPAYQFDSHAANQEYTMLSSIFADASGNISTPTQTNANPTAPGLSQPLFQLDTAWPDENGMSMSGQQGPPSGPNANSNTQPPYLNRESSSMSGLSGATSQQDADRQVVFPQNPFADIAKRSAAALGMDSMFPQEMSTMTATQVYNDVNKPYPYTEGYHFLMRYLTQNFDQGDILKVVKSLAAFRPSLIALQMPLSVEDEVFLEKSFQRTLIELEKLISYSGTPTAVWRRTGEICLAGDEFCRLTEFHRSDLLGKKTFIYELFEKQSVIDYFEKFSQYAFENTTQNFFWQCILVTASGKQVPCSCSFTIRRDVFDLPSVVIGQLLPIDA